MDRHYKYKLDRSSKKFVCPSCGKKRFVRYVDTSTNNYISSKFGRCDREESCGYKLNPQKDYLIGDWNKKMPEVKVQTKTTSTFIPYTLFSGSLKAYHKNNFIAYLLRVFDLETVQYLVEKYFIGTSNYWNGGTVFWQVDLNGHVRAGKIMLYDSCSGKRVKEPENCISWVHRAAKIKNFNLSQCLFGEHLLIHSPGSQKVALVESEKTAIISSIYFPDLIWLASGQLNGLSVEKCGCLRGRTVILFPDANGFNKWAVKAVELKKAIPGTRFEVSDILERYATDNDKYAGFDLADYLLKYDPRLFLNSKEPLQDKRDPISQKSTCVVQLESKQNEKWNISEIESFFNKYQPLAQPLRLNQWMTIIDIKQFIESHIATATANNGIRVYRPYFERLIKLKEFIEQVDP